MTMKRKFRTASKLIATATLLGTLEFSAAHSQPLSAPLSSPQTIPQNQAYPDYILGPGDEVSVTVFGYEEYSLITAIEPNGTVVLPVVGPINIAGRSPAAAAQEIEARLDYYLVDPVASVALTSTRPVIVSISGEVQRPGPIRLEANPENNNRNNDGLETQLPVLSTALVEAGGVTPKADIRRVQVKRSLPAGEESVFTINLWDAVWSDSATEDLLLQAGDAVYVPELQADAELDTRLLARSSLAPDTVRVRVVGEVTAPGEVAVPPNSSLSSAVAIAGGPTVDARLSRTTFIRLNEEGVIEEEQINLESLTDSYQVQDGDVIIVPKKNSSSILDLAARALTPLNVIFNLLR